MSVPYPELVPTLLSNAVLVMPLALLVALVCRFVRRPAVVWCLWAMVLLKFVTPAWYSLPVEDLAAALTSTDDVSQLEESEPPEVPLLTTAAPVAVPMPVVDEPPTLIEQLAMSQLYESLHRPLPLVEGMASPDDLPPIELSLVEPIDADAGGTQRPTGGAWSALGEGSIAPETSTTPEGVSAERHARSWSFAGIAFPNSSLGTRIAFLASVWIIGSITLFCLTALRVWRFQRLVRRAEPGGDALTQTVQEIATRLGCRRMPEVRVTSGRVPPLLWVVGWKPVILLPTGLLSQLDDEQQSALLTHELAHYARRDHWTRWFELAVRCLYWWHPVAWWAGHRLREAEEQCCDAWVVSLTPDAARPYANALLTTLDFLNPPDHPVPALASSITPHRRSLHPFHRRLTMILEDHPSPTLTWTTRLGLLAVAVIVLPLSLVAVGDDPSQDTVRDSAKDLEIVADTDNEVPFDISTEPEDGGTEPDAIKVRLPVDSVDEFETLIGQVVDATERAVRTQASDDQTDEQPQDIQEVVFTLKNIKVGDVIRGLSIQFADADEKPLISVVESLSDEPTPVEQIKVTLKSDQLEDVRALIATMEETSLKLVPFDVDQLQRQLVWQIPAGVSPHKVARYIHGLFSGSENPPSVKVDGKNDRITVVGTGKQCLVASKAIKDAIAQAEASSVSDEPSDSTITVVRVHYPMPEELAKAFETFVNLHAVHFEFLSGTTQQGAITLQGQSPRDGTTKTLTTYEMGLTIIAPEDVQQQFGDFIRAITEAKLTQDEEGNEPDTLTLSRTTYPISVLKPQRQEDFVAPLPARPLQHLSPHAGLDVLLHAARSTAQLSPLRTHIAPGQLTVTTTPRFQEALGKFIAFLKEQPPADPMQPPPSMDEARAKKLNAAFLLARAREAIKADDPDQARQLAMDAQKLDADYDLFSDRPELVLQDLRDASTKESGEQEQPSSWALGSQISRPGPFIRLQNDDLVPLLEETPSRPLLNLRGPQLTIEQQLASLRMQERMIAAEIATIEKSLESDASRAALALMIGRKYADNAVTRKLVEQFGKLSELQQEIEELMRTLGGDHPDVNRLIDKRESLRQSLGLPKNSDQPPDLVTLHLESLKLQQQLLRESINALQDTQAESKPERNSNVDLNDLNISSGSFAKELIDLLVAKSDLTKELGDNHPTVLELRKRISEMNDRIKDDPELESALHALKKEMDRLQEKIKELEQDKRKIQTLR